MGICFRLALVTARRDGRLGKLPTVLGFTTRLAWLVVCTPHMRSCHGLSISVHVERVVVHCTSHVYGGGWRGTHEALYVLELNTMQGILARQR